MRWGKPGFLDKKLPTEKRQQGMIQNQGAATNLENRNRTDSIENISCYPLNPPSQLLLPMCSVFSSGIILLTLSYYYNLIISQLILQTFYFPTLF